MCDNKPEGYFTETEWLADHPELEPEPPTIEELISIYMGNVQNRLDTFAQSEGRAYDNMLSACTYATSTNLVFAAEGQYCVGARDNTWAAAYKIMNDVISGQRQIPAWEEIEAELPELAWPGMDNAKA